MKMKMKDEGRRHVACLGSMHACVRAVRCVGYRKEGEETSELGHGVGLFWAEGRIQSILHVGAAAAAAALPGGLQKPQRDIEKKKKVPEREGGGGGWRVVCRQTKTHELYWPRKGVGKRGSRGSLN